MGAAAVDVHQPQGPNHRTPRRHDRTPPGRRTRLPHRRNPECRDDRPDPHLEDACRRAARHDGLRRLNRPSLRPRDALRRAQCARRGRLHGGWRRRGISSSEVPRPVSIPGDVPRPGPNRAPRILRRAGRHRDGPLLPHLLHRPHPAPSHPRPPLPSRARHAAPAAAMHAALKAAEDEFLTRA